MAKSLAAFRELSLDELRSKERELDDHCSVSASRGRWGSSTCR